MTAPLSGRARDAIAEAREVAWAEGVVTSTPIDHAGYALAAIPAGETLPISALLDELERMRAETVADRMHRSGWSKNEVGAAMDGRYAGADLDRLAGEAEPPLTDAELSAGIAGLSMENLRLRAALTDIAGGECCGFCATYAEDEACDVCTARKALA